MKKQYEDVLFYKIIRPIITLLFPLLFKPKIIGEENIPTTGAVILAGNHTHIFDCLLLISSTKRCIHFLAKKELWIGIKKIIFANLGLIPVDRKKKDHRALEEAEKYLNNEKVIGIFPEGTTEKEKGKMLPFKMGAIKMAKDTNTKIVPFAIKGDYKLFSKNLSITFGKSIEVKSNDLEVEKERLGAYVKALIEGDK